MDTQVDTYSGREHSGAPSFHETSHILRLRYRILAAYG
jgi:hypothetical protein